MLSCVAKLCFIIQGVFLMVPPRKLRSMKMVPPNSEKMTRFTGSTQNTIKSWLSLKNNKYRINLVCFLCNNSGGASTSFLWLNNFHKQCFDFTWSFFHYWAEPFPYLEVFWAERGGFDLIYRGTDGFKHCCRQV